MLIVPETVRVREGVVVRGVPFRSQRAKTEPSGAVAGALSVRVVPST